LDNEVDSSCFSGRNDEQNGDIATRRGVDSARDRSMIERLVIWRDVTDRSLTDQYWSSFSSRLRMRAAAADVVYIGYICTPHAVANCKQLPSVEDLGQTDRLLTILANPDVVRPHEIK